LTAGHADRTGMERKWLQIRVLPVGEDTTPWLHDDQWIRSLRVVLDRLDEDQRRWVLGLLSLQVGRGGISRLSEISHMDNDTFTKARKELAEELKSCPRQRIRRAGAGRKPLTQTDPSLEDDLQQLIENDIAGDPGSDDQWVRQTLRQLQGALQVMGHTVSHTTVCELLKKKGFRCKRTANASPVLHTRTATDNSSTCKSKRKRSSRRAIR
jgi:hypothetical protein